MREQSLLSIKQVLRVILCYRGQHASKWILGGGDSGARSLPFESRLFTCQLCGLCQLLNSAFSPSSSGKWRVEGNTTVVRVKWVQAGNPLRSMQGKVWEVSNIIFYYKSSFSYTTACQEKKGPFIFSSTSLSSENKPTNNCTHCSYMIYLYVLNHSELPRVMPEASLLLSLYARH